jgi:hypothetical protein
LALGCAALSSSTLNWQTFSVESPNAAGVAFALGVLYIIIDDPDL